MGCVISWDKLNTKTGFAAALSVMAADGRRSNTDKS